MNGQPFTRHRRAARRWPEALAELARANTRAVVHYRSTSAAFWLLVLVNARRRRRRGATARRLGPRPAAGPGRAPAPGAGLAAPPHGRDDAAPALLRVLALGVAALPVSTYLANLVPWERSRLAALGAGRVGAGRRRRWSPRSPPSGRGAADGSGPAVVVLAVTLATLAADVLTGSHLELDGAARLRPDRRRPVHRLRQPELRAAVGQRPAAHRRRCRRAGPPLAPAPSRRTWLLPVLVAGVVCVVLIGAPSLGRDFGGVLAAVPGFLVLGMLLARIRVTVGPAGRRPGRGRARRRASSRCWTGSARPTERSHLGRFVAQVLDGQAWTVVSRKAEANLGDPARQPAGLDAAGRAAGRRLAAAPGRPAAQPARAGPRPGCRPRTCGCCAPR